MVVFLDLDEDVSDDTYGDASIDLAGNFSSRLSFIKSAVNDRETGGETSDSGDVKRHDPNLNATTQALGCYPIINLITHNIDLNTLHALSRTCRQIRSSLLQYRSSLIISTLHCTNETHPSPTPSARPSSIPQWHFLSEATSTHHLASGGGGSKTSVCARDLVSACWRCRTIICRNCMIKSSQTPRLPSRLRRLCPTCLTAPLSLLMTPTTTTTPRTSSATSATNLYHNRSVHSPPPPDEAQGEAVRKDSFCTCAIHSHICAPCGSKLLNADTTYGRIWTWRTRYTTYLGGLGTGIGEGNEGVKCARGKDCLDAQEVEVEFECPSSSGSDGSESGGDTSTSAAAIGTTTGGAGFGRVGTPKSTTSTATGASPVAAASTPDILEEKAGYWRQEVEGLGGVVKKKFRKRERMGRTVIEWEDEREGKGEVLRREKQGLCRSWCGWCGKVVLKDEDDGRGKKWSEEEGESRVVRIEMRGVRGL